MIIDLIQDGSSIPVGINERVLAAGLKRAAYPLARSVPFEHFYGSGIEITNLQPEIPTVVYPSQVLNDYLLTPGPRIADVPSYTVLPGVNKLTISFPTKAVVMGWSGVLRLVDLTKTGPPLTVSTSRLQVDPYASGPGFLTYNKQTFRADIGAQGRVIVLPSRPISLGLQKWVLETGGDGVTIVVGNKRDQAVAYEPDIFMRLARVDDRTFFSCRVKTNVGNIDRTITIETPFGTLITYSNAGLAPAAAIAAFTAAFNGDPIFSVDYVMSDDGIETNTIIAKNKEGSLVVDGDSSAGYNTVVYSWDYIEWYGASLYHVGYPTTIIGPRYWYWEDTSNYHKEICPISSTTNASLAIWDRLTQMMINSTPAANFFD